MTDLCIPPNIYHDPEFVIAAFGQVCWKCKLCGCWLDEFEDGLTG